MNKCVFYCRLDHYGWSSQCVTFATLSEYDIKSYLKCNRIIAKEKDDNIIINEKNLIANRLMRKNILVNDAMLICPKHRSSFGIDWIDRKSTCYHPDHDPNSNVSIADCRRANLNTCLRVEGFPIDGGLVLFI